MQLITQPDDGIKPLMAAVARARKCVDVVIFRFDVKPLEQELESAVSRGVAVRALVAHTNTGGEKKLRELEHRLLAAGVAVARTNDDLVRYHGKLLLVDRTDLYILGFNFTSADLKSRSLGIHIKSPRIIRDVAALIDADAARTEHVPCCRELVVSPENARARLSAFLRKATQSLEIYDPNLTDDAMIRLLKERAARGVTIRILGKLEKKWRGDDLPVRSLAGMRLHVRAIVRDGRRAFVGSQSLRRLELDDRREVGLIVREPSTVKAIREVFEKDWANAR